MTGGRAAQVGPSATLRESTASRTIIPHVRFDPEKRAASEALKRRITSLVRHLKQREIDLKLRHRARDRKAEDSFSLTIEALASNLFFLLKAGTGHALAVPRDNNFMHAKGRYRAEVYGSGFPQALNLLTHPAIGLAEDLQRGFKVGSRSEPSLISPLPALEGVLSPHDLPWDSIYRLEPREVLVLKSKKDRQGEADYIDYEDTNSIRVMRNAVRRINKHLQAAPIFLDIPDGGTFVDQSGHPVDPTQRPLRRIFNNGSWLEGGRLFGGFWESMPRRQRFDHLRLGSKLHPDGESIVNVDLRQLFPRLAYHRMRIDPPEGDLYAVTCENDPNRSGWKQLINAQLCAGKPLTNWPDGVHEAFPEAITFKQAVAALTVKHAPIAHLFGTGIGMMFMTQESEALLRVLSRLYRLGITALPLHDSVLVPCSEAEVAKDVMMESMKFIINWDRAEVSIDFGQ